MLFYYFHSSYTFNHGFIHLSLIPKTSASFPFILPWKIINTRELWKLKVYVIRAMCLSGISFFSKHEGLQQLQVWGCFGVLFFAFESRMLLQDECNKALYLQKPEFAVTWFVQIICWVFFSLLDRINCHFSPGQSTNFQNNVHQKVVLSEANWECFSCK